MFGQLSFQQFSSKKLENFQVVLLEKSSFATNLRQGLWTREMGGIVINLNCHKISIRCLIISSKLSRFMSHNRVQHWAEESFVASALSPIVRFCCCNYRIFCPENFRFMGNTLIFQSRSDSSYHTLSIIKYHQL